MNVDPVERFQLERAQTLESYSQDEAFQMLSRHWVAASMARRYVYNFDWLGRPIIQYPQEMVAVQEIIWRTRPDLVIETGIAHGGSLTLSASMLALLDYCDAADSGKVLDPARPSRTVLGIDIDIRPHNRSAILSHPMASRIRMLEGSSIDPKIVAQVAEAAKGAERVMICLDSNHTHDHVLAELRAYSHLVTPGCYCIVFDTFVEDMEPGFIPDRPWDVGNNPRTAVREWLPEAPDFAIDHAVSQRLMVSACPEGFLRRRDGTMTDDHPTLL